MKISCAGCERALARWDRALPASRVPVPPVRGIAALPWDRLCRVSAPGALPFSSAVPLGWGRCVLCAGCSGRAHGPGRGTRAWRLGPGLPGLAPGAGPPRGLEGPGTPGVGYTVKTGVFV